MFAFLARSETRGAVRNWNLWINVSGVADWNWRFAILFVLFTFLLRKGTMCLGILSKNRKSTNHSVIYSGPTSYSSFHSDTSHVRLHTWINSLRMRSQDQIEATRKQFFASRRQNFFTAPSQARQKVLNLDEKQEEAARGSGLEVYLIDVYFIRLNIWHSLTVPAIKFPCFSGNAAYECFHCRSLIAISKQSRSFQRS